MAPQSFLSRLIPLRFRKSVPVVNHVVLNGAIGMGTPLRPALTFKSTSEVLERAFSKKGIAAVALSINSPGGSPVQSALIHTRIRELADEHKVPVLVFCEDVAASGGYWLACAGDEIYADESSIVGSIGVISAGFGFVDAISKLGVERRVYTSGESKSMLDPFKPEKAEDVSHLQNLQADVHGAFKELVKSRRGNRLKGEDGELFFGRLLVRPSGFGQGADRRPGPPAFCPEAPLWRQNGCQECLGAARLGLEKTWLWRRRA